MSARLTAAKIRAAYPAPIDVHMSSANPEEYCVGGALCLTVFGMFHFPNRPVLARALYETNPKLTLEEARRYAFDVVAANDRGDFDAAWAVLDEALAYPLAPSDADLRDSVFLREQAD